MSAPTAPEAPGTELELRREAESALGQPLPPMSDGEVSALFRTAKALAESRLFKDAGQAGQAFAKILAGRDLGLTPFEAMSQLHVLEGKIEASSDLHATRLRQHEGLDYRVAWIKVEDWEGQGAQAVPCGFHAVYADEEDPLDLRDTFGCIVAVYDAVPPGGRAIDGKLRGVSRWTRDDSVRANLERERGGKVSPHVAYPRNMYFARAMTNAVAFYAPEVMRGLRVYGTGEIPRDGGEDLGAGRGGAAPVMDALPTEVEAVLARARELGHDGLSKRETASVMVQAGPEQLQRWLKRATAALNRLSHAKRQGDEAKAAEVIEADVVVEPEPAAPVEAAQPSDPAPEPETTGEAVDGGESGADAAEGGGSGSAPSDEDAARRARLEEALADAERAAEDFAQRGDSDQAAYFRTEADSIRAQLSAADPSQTRLGL